MDQQNNPFDSGDRKVERRLIFFLSFGDLLQVNEKTF